MTSKTLREGKDSCTGKSNDKKYNDNSYTITIKHPKRKHSQSNKIFIRHRKSGTYKTDQDLKYKDTIRVR